MPHRKLSQKAGKPPGTMEYTGHRTETPTRIIAVKFGADHFRSSEITSPEMLKEFLESDHGGLK
ncbi:MAG: hypothetical protein EDM75_08950, partial [Chlorobiota bacterium]